MKEFVKRNKRLLIGLALVVAGICAQQPLLLSVGVSQIQEQPNELP